MAYDAVHKVVVLFGGTGSGGPLSDTWIWNGREWLQQFPVVSPPPRDSAGMTFDGGRQRVVLFGGEGLNFSLLTDTWTWDGSNWHRESPAHSPDGFRNFAFAFYPPTASSILYGTLNGTGFAPRSTWSWDGNDWTKLTPTDLPPFNVGAGGAMTYTQATRSLLLFGGSDQTWTWDGVDWHYLEGPGPGSRQFLPMALDATGAAVIYGGSNAPLGDTWAWNGAWTHRQPAHSPTEASSSSANSALAYDADSGQTVLFGGSANGDQTWLWDGTDWTLAS